MGCVTIPGRFTFDSCGSDYDTWLRVWTLEDADEVAECDDCGQCEVRSVLSTTLVVGCYLLVVDGYLTNEGAFFRLRWLQWRREARKVGNAGEACEGRRWAFLCRLYRLR